MRPTTTELLTLAITLTLCASCGSSTEGDAEPDSGNTTTDAANDSGQDDTSDDGSGGWSLVEVGGETTVGEDAGVITLTTTGSGYIEAPLPDGADGFTVDVDGVSEGSRVSFFVKASDTCGNAASFVLGAQVTGNVKGWLYTCDYLDGACGLDDKDCDAPAGRSTLSEGQSFGIWHGPDGSIVQSVDGSASSSSMAGFVDASALAARSYGVYVETGDAEMTVTLRNLTTSATPGTDGAAAAGPCAREAALSCD